MADNIQSSSGQINDTTIGPYFGEAIDSIESPLASTDSPLASITSPLNENSNELSGPSDLTGQSPLVTDMSFPGLETSDYEPPPGFNTDDINSSKGGGSGNLYGDHDFNFDPGYNEIPFPLPTSHDGSTPPEEGIAPLVPEEGIPIPDLPGGDNPDYLDDLPPPGSSGCVINSRQMYMTMEITEDNPDKAADNEDAIGTTNSSSGSSSGISGGSTSNSQSTSSNSASSILIKDGNTIIPFDSIHMSLPNYSEFVEHHGGIVTNSGIYPYNKLINDTSIVFNNLKISTEGSTMDIVQESLFDAATILNEGNKVWGYIINNDGDIDPIFIGYVHEISKKLTESKQVITYQCKDLAAYLSTYFTSALYKYRPPHTNSSHTARSINYILGDILIKAGITTGNIELPDNITCPPIEFKYETIKNVLEWFCKYLGNYTYYIDRYGKLNVKSVKSGSDIGSFEVPTAGTSINDTFKIKSFTSLSNYERARSKIILTGDYPITEIVENGTWSLQNITGDALSITSKGFFKSGTVKSPVVASKMHRYLAVQSDKELQSFLITEPTRGPYIKLDKSYVGYFIKQNYATPDYKAPQYIYSSTTISGHTSPKRLILYNSFTWYNAKLREEYNKTISHAIATDGLSVANELIFDLTLFTNIAGDAILVNTTDKSYLYSKNSFKLMAKYAYKDLIPLQSIVNTEYLGGIEVIKRPEFKKITANGVSIDDSALLNTYAKKLKDYYKPIYGGSLVLDGLHTHIELLDKISITNTDLTDKETSNLIIYGISYDIAANTTTLELSSNTFLDAPYFDLIRERKRETNEELVKLGQLENSELYKTM